MSYENIPDELKRLPQWVCWNENKVPIDAKTGFNASPTNPATWSPYGVAARAAHQHRGIGFVLTENDPYCFIDLDAGGDAEDMALQKQVFEYMDSYTEVSPSGRGLHIIVRAAPPYSRRSQHIEVYGKERYMTMTGVLYRDAGIMDRQLHVEQLLSKLGRPIADVPIINSAQTEDDSTLLDRMFLAQNGDSIQRLWYGEWSDRYGSQSEADFALINHLVFYTQCPDQVLRLFRMSGLGQRPKALRDDYLIGMVRRASDQFEPGPGPTIDIEAIKRNLVDSSEPALPQSPPSPKIANCFPEGLVGHIAQFIYGAYTRPVPEIALAGAIGLMSGICGRSYNVSGTGLNMYTLLLADTGTGKEAMASGISLIRQQLANVIPAATEFIGPSFASGQALSRHIAEKSPSFVSVFSEFGEKLAQYTSSKASSTNQALATLFLELYSKSGKGILLPGTVFADTAKNTKDLVSPAFSILGEATPETYYGAVDEFAIAKGLLPRFLVIDYTGPRVARRDVAPEATAVHPDVLRWLVNLCDASLRLMLDNTCVDVQMTTAAQLHLDAFDTEADRRINTTNKDVTRQLWNRAHLKALKLAALLAVGVNHHSPVISLEQAQWAQQVVEADIMRVITRFENGDVGVVDNGASDFDKRVDVLRRCLRAYPTYDMTEKINETMKPGMQEANIIPHSTLRRHAAAHPAFRKAPGYKNSSQLFEEAVKILLEDEVIAVVPHDYMRMTYGHRGKAYLILNTS